MEQNVSTECSFSTSKPLCEKARRVLEGATRIFLDNGYQAATTDMIQRAAGVSKSTVYSYYRSKEALFVAVIETECGKFFAKMRERKFHGDNLEIKLTKIALAYLERVLSPEGLALYRMIVAEAPRLPEIGRAFYLAGPGHMNSVVAKKLKAAMDSGEIDLGGVGVDAAASLFASMVRGEGQMQSILHPESSPSAAQQDQWAKDAVTVFLQAFRKR